MAIGINDDIAGTLDASYYKGCGARAGTEREVVLAPVAIPVENHPQDSRVKLSADGTVQTLSGQMGTGGGNVPLILQERFACGCGQDAPEEEKEP